MRLACRIAVAAAVVGVFVTWFGDGPVRLDGTEGPSNGWLVLVVALLSLLWVQRLDSWVGVVGVAGSGLVIAWTALESWLGARATTGASVAPGLVLVVGAGVVLLGVALARAWEETGLRHRST
jgi:hypothetical protein